MAEGDELLTHKVGPLPVILWVGGGAALVFLFLMLSRRSSGGQAMQTNQVSSLAPTEAEAFGTIEQQQQDVTNALTTLGNNQSYLGGSLASLSGLVTQQGLYNSSQFQNLLNGQQSIQQGQTDAATNAQNYYQTLLNNISAYGSQIYNQQAADYLSLYNQGQSNFSQLSLIMTDPWVHQYYQNQQLAGLNPFQQAMYWIATRQVQQGTPSGTQAVGNPALPVGTGSGALDTGTQTTPTTPPNPYAMA